MTSLRAKLLKLIHGRGMSQNALASAIHVDASQLSRWLKEGGVHNHMPTPEQFVKLSEFFGVPLIYLMDDRMDEVPVERGPEDQLPEDVQRLLWLAEMMGGPDAMARKVLGTVPPQVTVLAEPVRRAEVNGPSVGQKKSS